MSTSTKILIAVFVALAIVAYFLFPSEKARETSYKSPEVNLAIDSASIVKIEIDRPGKPVKLENIGGRWEITSPVQYAANATSVTELIAGLRKLKAESLISSNPEKQNLFQVDSSGSKVVLTDRSGKTTSLIVGKMGPSYSDVYFRLADSKNVYLGEGLNSWVVNREVNDWRDKTVFSASADSIKGLSLTYRGKNYVLRRDSTTWRYGKDTVATTVMTSMLNALSNLHADGFVDTLYQPKTQPFKMRVWTPGEADLSFFPEPPDTSKYFVQTSQSPQGFTLSKWSVRPLLAPIEKIQK